MPKAYFWTHKMPLIANQPFVDFSDVWLAYNAELAAWFLRQRLNAPGGGDYWTRVATYHSATPKFNAIYRGKLIPLAARWGRWLQANYKTSISYH